MIFIPFSLLICPSFSHLLPFPVLFLFFLLFLVFQFIFHCVSFLMLSLSFYLLNAVYGISTLLSLVPSLYYLCHFITFPSPFFFFPHQSSHFLSRATFLPSSGCHSVGHSATGLLTLSLHPPSALTPMFFSDIFLAISSSLPLSYFLIDPFCYLSTYLPLYIYLCFAVYL